MIKAVLRNSMLAVASLIIVATSAISLTVLSSPKVAAAPAGCTDTFLTFPAWYKGMQKQSDGCNFQPKETKDPATGKMKVDFKATTIAIILNVVNIILQLVGYASAIMIIVGGFNYMTSQGEASKMSNAKQTIQNAIIGLIISILSVAIVNLVAGVL